LKKNKHEINSNIQQPFQNQLHPLPSNKVITITFINLDDSRDSEMNYEDECLEIEEKS